MSEKIDRMNTSGPWLSLRFFLIKLIAGKATVLLNAKIEIVDRRPEYCGSLSGGAFFLSSCDLPATETQMLRISKEVTP